MSMHHLGEAAAEPFDPIAALAAQGIAAPEPIKPEDIVPQFTVNTVNDLQSQIEGLEVGQGLRIPLDEINPAVIEQLFGGEPGQLMLPGFLQAAADRPMLEIDHEPAVPAEPTRGINPKDALGLAKPDLSVVPPAAMLHLASAMMDGARKYGPFNWRDNAVLGRVYVAAAMRHLMQYLDGEDIDPTSGVHHLGHAMACAAIVLDARETGNLDDNRPHSGVTGDMIRRWTPDSKFG